MVSIQLVVPTAKKPFPQIQGAAACGCAWRSAPALPRNSAPNPPKMWRSPPQKKNNKMPPRRAKQGHPLKNMEKKQRHGFHLGLLNPAKIWLVKGLSTNSWALHLLKCTVLLALHVVKPSVRDLARRGKHLGPPHLPSRVLRTILLVVLSRFLRSFLAVVALRFPVVQMLSGEKRKLSSHNLSLVCLCHVPTIASPFQRSDIL